MFKMISKKGSGFFNQCSRFAQQHSGLFNNILLLGLVATAAAAVTDGFSQEEICAELFSYQKMCELSNLNFVSFSGPVTFTNPEGNILGQSDDAQKSFCNVYEFFKQLLGEDQVAACQQAFGNH